jgi:lipid II:glycine glycyltransferase (peptidoglycan interpeptide bridge formation enzyme)
MALDATLQPITNAFEWETACLAPGAHLLQTFAWGELKQQFGWRAERIAWRTSEKILAGAQILYRRLAPGMTLAYIPRGPFGEADETLSPFLAALVRHTRARGAFLLKVEPDWERDDRRTKILRAAHAQHSIETIQPSATIHLDLTADLDTILARMKSKWRYNIRLAEKKGVVVRAGTTADLPAFHELMRVTGARDKFAIHDLNYYRAAFELLSAREHARLFIADYATQPLAMIFVTALADQAIYLYGASGNAERNRMPNHALHWSAIQWAKAHDCTRYDFWGIPETIAENDESENLPSSLYQFKQGFGGEIVRYTGAWDFVFSPAKYRLYQLARKIRKSGFG